MIRWVPLVALVVAAVPPRAAADDAKAATVAPLVGDEIAVIAHVDLDRADAPALAGQLLGDVAAEAEVKRTVQTVAGVLDGFRRAGAKDLYVLVDPADMPGPPTVVVPLAKGADAEALSKLLAGGPLRSLGGVATATVRGAVVAAPPAALARIRNAEPAARPELAQALSAGGAATVRIVLIPSRILRRALDESVATLPAELGGGPMTTLTQGLRWASLALVTAPRPALRAVAQAKDEDAAKALRGVFRSSVELVRSELGRNPAMAELARWLGELDPRVERDRLTLEADAARTAALVAVSIRQARENARRAQCVNNLRQISLAMHNYHSAHNSFPAAYNASKDGKPLLSWRVHILPFLDQKALYDQFHLDEPWDSPHNRALVASMPRVYVCPSGDPRLVREGKTTYLTPRGPDTAFPGAQGVPIKDVPDGTSNTVMVVDAANDRAVVWTRPDDWEVGPKPSARELVGHHPGGTNFAFADGAVKFLPEGLSSQVLRALTTRNGGEVIMGDSAPRP